MGGPYAHDVGASVVSMIGMLEEGIGYRIYLVYTGKSIKF